MTLSPNGAEKALLARYGEPAKEPTDYIIGFRAPVGRVLAIHRTTQETRIWFQPPAPPQLDGVRLLDEPNNGNSNINGLLAPLKQPDTQRVEIDSATALQRFLDRYDGSASPEAGTERPFRLRRRGPRRNSVRVATSWIAKNILATLSMPGKLVSLLMIYSVRERQGVGQHGQAASIGAGYLQQIHPARSYRCGMGPSKPDC